MGEPSYESRKAPATTSAALSRLVLLGMLPALAERDLAAFGEAAHDFNARVGEVFAGVQGGTYSSPATAGLIGWLRGQGVAGVGQSSWGPGVFAVVGDEDVARHLAARLGAFLAPGRAETFISRGCNRGATIEDQNV